MHRTSRRQQRAGHRILGIWADCRNSKIPRNEIAFVHVSDSDDIISREREKAGTLKFLLVMPLSLASTIVCPLALSISLSLLPLLLALQTANGAAIAGGLQYIQKRHPPYLSMRGYSRRFQLVPCSAP